MIEQGEDIRIKLFEMLIFTFALDRQQGCRFVGRSDFRRRNWGQLRQGSFHHSCLYSPLLYPIEEQNSDCELGEFRDHAAFDWGSAILSCNSLRPEIVDFEKRDFKLGLDICHFCDRLTYL